VGDALNAAGRHDEATASYKSALDVSEKVAAQVEREETAGHGKPGPQTADQLGSLAWMALMARQFDRALSASQRAAELDPDLIWVKTNLAHALMFLGRTEEATALYLQYRGKTTFEGTTWEQSVLDDFTKLRAAGLANPLMDIIQKDFQS
jgi:Flp pilus assembly protein TadD